MRGYTTLIISKKEILYTLKSFYFFDVTKVISNRLVLLLVVVLCNRDVPHCASVRL